MILGEEALSWSHLVSVLATLGLTFGAKYARKVRGYLYDLWANFQKLVEFMEVLGEKVKRIEGLLDQASSAKSLGDVQSSLSGVKTALKEIRQETKSVAQDVSPAKPNGGQ